MKVYTPRRGTCAWRAILWIDERGAQYSDVLAKHLGVKQSALNINMDCAVRAGVLGHERRKRDGLSVNVWFITPKAFPVLERMQEVL